MCVCTEKFGAKQLAEGEMSGEWKTTVVPVDVVSGIVQQLSEVSRHTTTASNAMRHLVAEIAQLRELRSRDATSVAEALATVGSKKRESW